MLTQHFPYAIYTLTNQSKLLRSPTNQTPIDEMKPHFPIFHSHFHLLHSAKFSLNYLDTGIAGEAASALETRQGMLTKREIPTSLTLNQHTHTHTHELAHTHRDSAGKLQQPQTLAQTMRCGCSREKCYASV